MKIDIRKMSRSGFNFSIDSLMAPSLASRFGPMYGYFFMPSAPLSQVTSPSGLPPEMGLSSANFPFAHPAFTGHPFYSATNPYYSAQTSSFEQLQRFMRKDSTSPMTDSRRPPKKSTTPSLYRRMIILQSRLIYGKPKLRRLIERRRIVKVTPHKQVFYLLLTVPRRYVWFSKLLFNVSKVVAVVTYMYLQK